MSFAAVSNLVGSKQRATSVALLSLFLTLFGAGIGPLLTGTFSDVFATEKVGEGLQTSIMVMLLMLTLSAFLYYRAIAPYFRHMTDVGIEANQPDEKVDGEKMAQLSSKS